MILFGQFLNELAAEKTGGHSQAEEGDRKMVTSG